MTESGSTGHLFVPVYIRHVCGTWYLVCDQETENAGTGWTSHFGQNVFHNSAGRVRIFSHSVPGMYLVPGIVLCSYYLTKDRGGMPTWTGILTLHRGVVYNSLQQIHAPTFVVGIACCCSQAVTSSFSQGGPWSRGLSFKYH